MVDEAKQVKVVGVSNEPIRFCHLSEAFGFIAFFSPSATIKMGTLICELCHVCELCREALDHMTPTLDDQPRITLVQLRIPMVKRERDDHLELKRDFFF